MACMRFLVNIIMHSTPNQTLMNQFFSFLLLSVFCLTPPCFAGNLAYITNQGSDSVTVLDIAAQKIMHTIATGKAPVGVAIAAKTNRIYISNANSQTRLTNNAYKKSQSAFNR